MEFYAERNGNTTYSAKLYKLFTKNTNYFLNIQNWVSKPPLKA